MKVTLLGAGCGRPETMTKEALDALEKAELIFGARRVLEHLPGTEGERIPEVRPEKILARLAGETRQRICVVFSGDTGFYSGARAVLEGLRQGKAEVELLPGVSSLQYFAARLGRPWQDWNLCSSHGVSCDPVPAVSGGRTAFFLTGGGEDPGRLCLSMAQAGLGSLPVTLGENLGTPEERIRTGRAEDFAGAAFATLTVLLAEAAPVSARPGVPDEDFCRGSVPMTKQEVRAAVAAKLRVGPGCRCWDIGAGTGSVSVELALRGAEVWAVEENPEALALIHANREKFHAWNLRIAEGRAPAVLEGLPRPDRVFVGGSGGALAEILSAVERLAPGARVCVSAVTLESLHTAGETLKALGYDAETVQISVARAVGTGRVHMMRAQNPVFLLTGCRA